ncbi:MAG: WecB/TagA/CpsF family glycosyltransferase [Defluviitaleaceae bacterium]|nr:WecB/TagA/CpsF family glycosyltransferase [Defluviitaleaceae bacterium]
MKTVTILDVPFAALAFNEALDLLETYLYENRNHIVVTPNPEGVMLTLRNPVFAQAIADADLRLADGTGIVLAARYKKTPLPERVRGLDVTYALFERLSQKRKTTAYFLGAAPGVAQRAKTNIEKRFPGLSVVGQHHGYFTPGDETEEKVLSEINDTQPDILLVCTGMPRAEIWAAAHRDLPVRITLCVGGTMDVMAGNVRLAPKCWRALGLEWLYRLITQPKRARRMLDIPRFIFAVSGGK